ncbi:universal stress protein UspA [Halobacteriales archaeon QS_5_70_17]|nr:MAG: universal stress protein UspA [Halobacteriales archaeon QS_5_70_17]
MTRYLLAVDSVHTAAAAADALDSLDAEDAVVAVGVVPEGATGADARERDRERDVDDALNAVRVRFAVPAVEPDRREGVPDEEILAAAADHGADRIVLGTRGGAPDDRAAGGLGGTTAAVLASTDRPALVVPTT